MLQKLLRQYSISQAMFKLILLIGLLIIPSGLLADELYVANVTLSQAKPDTQMVKDLLDELSDIITKGDYALARQKTQKAKEWSEELNFEYGKAFSELKLARIYLNVQLFDSAEVLLRQVVDNYDDVRINGSTYNLLGTAYRFQSKMPQAIEAYKLALNIAEVQEDKRLIAGIQQNMAVAYGNMGDKNASLENFLLSLKYAEEIQDTALWVTVLLNLGNQLNGFNELDKAVFYLEKSAELSSIMGYRTNLYRSTLNLANVKSNQGKLEEALELYTEALKMSKEVRPNTPPVIVVFNLGNLYLKMGEYEKSEELLKESLNYSIEMGIPEGQYYNYNALGRLERERGDTQASIAWFLKANVIAKNINSVPFLSENLPVLYKSFKKEKQFEEALLYLEESKALSDSLMDFKREQEFLELKNELELKRQTDINELLKQKQIQQEQRLRFQTSLIIAGFIGIILILIILYVLQKASREKTKANILLEEQREELEKLNQEMKKLFAIVAHDLRSPLASMQGVLYLMRSHELSKDKQEEFLDSLDASVQRNMDAMEDLLAWAKNQMQGFTFINEEVNVYEIVESVIVKQLDTAAKKNVIIKNEIDQTTTAIADKNGLDLILRNLLSNSIKYTNPNDEITFTCTEKENTIYLCVKDTGEGMSQEVLEKVCSNTSISYSKRGTMGETGTGFGLSLVKEFVKKIGGTFHVESTVGEGSTFCIEIPKK